LISTFNPPEAGDYRARLNLKLLVQPHGVIDPITELGTNAEEAGLWFHVDTCLGGFLLPFLKELGQYIPPFDLRVPDVSSLSADLHKYGFAAKGASTIC